MSVLIVENNPKLGGLWCRHLQRLGHSCEMVCSQSDAIDVLQTSFIKVVVVNLCLKDGSTMAITDYIAYRYPDIRVIVVTAAEFFSQASVFDLISNASAMVGQETPPDDLAAIVEYHSV